MTERLYYTDAACLEFEATVLSCESSGATHTAVLDKTAFYPTSGGQPHDTGTLGGAAVVDVVDRDEAGIAHVVDAPLQPGSLVRGSVNGGRRFDHMQQHTGQHILSAAFDRLHGARTVGFHLGDTVSTLDLDRMLAPDAIAGAESDANRVVWEDRPVSVRFATAEEAAALQLRKEPTRGGPLRIIDVEGYDRSACGGTHVARSGAVGMVAVRGWEKVRGGLRLEFVCGRRALREFRSLRDAVTGSQRFLSVSPADLPGAIERAQGDNKALRKTIKDLQDSLAVHEAAQLVARAPLVGHVRVVVEAVPGQDQGGLKAMATAAASAPGVVAALLSATNPAVVVIARSPDVALDASALLKTLTGLHGGKGGGKPDLAQGGGLAAAPDALCAQVRQLIDAMLRPAP